jgi:hypothetical protein
LTDYLASPAVAGSAFGLTLPAVQFLWCVHVLQRFYGHACFKSKYVCNLQYNVIHVSFLFSLHLYLITIISFRLAFGLYFRSQVGVCASRATVLGGRRRNSARAVQGIVRL